MKLAIIGSRSLTKINVESYVSDNVDEIVSGGAVGVDSCAAEYAKSKGLKLTVFLPEYARYGRAAPIVRNKSIVDHADRVLVFWDGASRGTLSVIDYTKKLNKPIDVILCQ